MKEGHQKPLTTASATATTDASTTFATQPSSLVERRLACALLVVLGAVSLAAIPFRGHAFAETPAFVPAFAGTTAMADFLAATLLLGLYRVDGSRGVLAIAAAYLLDALLIVPYALTFPGVVDARGFIGNEQSAATLWLLWHVAFPAIVFGASRVFGTIREARVRRGNVRNAVGLAACFAVAATLVVTVGRDALPRFVHGGRFTHAFSGGAVVASVLSAAVAIVLARRVRPLPSLHLWLAVALAVAALDTALNAVAPMRYSFGWYVGKFETFVTAAVVLIALVGAWSVLYARSTTLTQRLERSLVQRRSLELDLERERFVSLTLQQMALPRTLPTFGGIALSAAYRPGSDEATIGGDWYDAFIVDEGRIAITIGDVMGHGLGAATVMTKLRQSMQAAALVDADPSTMLAVAGRTIDDTDTPWYATALALVYDTRTGELAIASAGHCRPLLRGPGGSVREIAVSGSMLGIDDREIRPVARFAPAGGSMLLLHTDGIVEATRDAAAGQRRLEATFADFDMPALAEPARAIVQRVLDDVEASDDIAVLTMHFVPA
ncbi:MAG: hypothetical protein NVS2B3_09170 [Vulcanimicrobiaceae bacterium]